MRIPLSQPDTGDGEIDMVTKALRSGRLSLGPFQEEFEVKFAKYAGMRHAIATSSGTTALHLCVKALGIGAGDDAITTSFSFVASTNCLLYESALPSFADIDPHTLNIDPREIRNLIERNYAWDSAARRMVNHRTGRILKAILPVHIFGLPCEMAPILEIAREFDLRVIEDACEALGAEYHGQRAGTFGDAAVFAFYPNKQLTAAEGGMIVTNDEHVAALCRSLRNQGRTENSGWLHHSLLGYNYRLSELHCALGLAQLGRIQELLCKRERVTRMYLDALTGATGIALPCQPPGFKRSWFVFPIQVLGPDPEERRAELMAGLEGHGIACKPYFPAIHRQPYFSAFGSHSGAPLPWTESAARRCLALPLFPSMTEEQVREVCSAARKTLNRIHARTRAVDIEREPAAPRAAP